MAKINMMELLEDREAGTPGPWRNSGCLYDPVIIETAHPMPDDDDSYGRQTVVGSSEWTYVRDADARRIARLPDLEAAYIDAVELIEDLLRAGDFRKGCEGEKAARKFLGVGE